MRLLLMIIVSLLVAAPAFAADAKKDDDAPKKTRAADSEDAKERSARRKAREEEMKSKAADESKEQKTRRATKETATEEPKAKRTAKGAEPEPAEEPAKTKESRRSRSRAEPEPVPPSKFEESVKRINTEIASRQVTRAALMPNAPPIARTPPRPKPATPHVQPHAAHWSYSGENGPHRWGAINPAWAGCASGSRQSPIDIRDGIKVDLDPIEFDYKPTRFTVVDNGHTIQVNLEGGNRIALVGRTYELVQFHFHMPAEERINGRGFEMVVHLVHKDAQERLAVVALLVERGTANAIVQAVWNNLPLERHEPVPARATIDLAQLLPERREYYTYMGSLTTPPCSEGVTWIVMKQPLQLSPTQLAIFQRLYPMNARPIQLQAGRVIKESN